MAPFNSDHKNITEESEFTDSDFEDDSEKTETDTSAQEARNGKDIHGISWDGFKYTRDEFRENRLNQYENFFNILTPSSRHILDKEHLEVEKGNNFYDFQFNTRLVTSTVVHFQLRNLVWATSKHDVYLMQNYSVIHWSSLLQRGKEVVNIARSVTPTLKLPGSLSEPLSKVQVSSMAVKENLILLGGFDGELLCKCVNKPGVAFCTRLTTEDNAITNAVDLYRSPSGSLRLITANNDCTIQVFDAQSFIRLKFTSDGRFLAMAEPADFVHIFDTQCGFVQCQEIDLFGEIAGISFSPDTEALYVRVADRTYGSLMEYKRRNGNQYMDSIFW